MLILFVLDHKHDQHVQFIFVVGQNQQIIFVLGHTTIGDVKVNSRTITGNVKMNLLGAMIESLELFL